MTSVVGDLTKIFLVYVKIKSVTVGKLEFAAL